MNVIANSLSLFKWLFVRLPLAFSVPFSAMSIWWVFSGFRSANDLIATPLTSTVTGILAAQLPASLGQPLIPSIDAFVHAAIVIGLFGLGFLVAYNLSALLNWTLLALKLKPTPYLAGVPRPPPIGKPNGGPLANVEKIGIVLAGGGAKGAYQAGAMRAIYRYLADHGALAKVKVISGTSIGSWNALFWLADLIDPAHEDQGIQERWWRSISAKSLAAPLWYVPFLRNAFLSSEPWRQAFDHIFGQDDVCKRLFASEIEFYLTRSDVRSGELACLTNNPHPPTIPRVSYDVLNRAAGIKAFLEGIKTGVFASMDLPPLFPYIRLGDRLFEDGGVIDNLPITFPAVQGCDLIFILPLNADFEEEPNETSIVARLFRVMDVRQGVLERNGFKMLYLYNELAALRSHVEKLQTAAQALDLTASAPLNSALQRRNQMISVFAVCPQKSFVQSTIDTQELWKHKEAGIAFDVMHAATAELLVHAKFGVPQDAIRVALISRGGNTVWDERF
jgi:NTE family protein